jgi:hypothetical protein
VSRVLSTIAAFSLLVTVASSARAQSNNSAMAVQAFNEGVRLLKQKKYDEACPLLARSAELEPKVGAYGSLAQCEEGRQHLAAARLAWLKGLDLAKSAHDDRQAALQAGFDSIDAKVPKLKILMSNAAPPGLKLSLDGAPVDLAALGIPSAVDAGNHVVKVEAPGKKSWSQTVEANLNGGTLDVVVPALEPDVPAEPAPLPAVVRSSAPASGESRPSNSKQQSVLRPIGLVAGGAGVLALGVGAAFWRAAIKKNDSSYDKSYCTDVNGHVCQPGSPGETDRKSAITDGNLATAFVIGGSVLTAGGLAMFLLAPRGDSLRTGSVRITPVVSTREPGVAMSGAF